MKVMFLQEVGPSTSPSQSYLQLSSMITDEPEEVGRKSIPLELVAIRPAAHLAPLLLLPGVCHAPSGHPLGSLVPHPCPLCLGLKSVGTGLEDPMNGLQSSK